MLIRNYKDTHNSNIFSPKKSFVKIINIIKNKKISRLSISNNNKNRRWKLNFSKLFNNKNT